ncbi:MAG TPA: cell envelope integrity protein CreD [Spirochaetota bacterium]|nr:cell envelope integrity protein CreD [Spirochaetota bacterium]HPS85495.1 cell envelope integrity protein CreD [Spirochaetota bacterium]
MKPLASKSLITSFLVLALLIPVSMVSSLVDERKLRQSEVYTGMSNSWGGENTVLGGIFLSFANETAMPDKTEIDGNIAAETRQKGIFKIPFYTANLIIKGTFNSPSAREGKKILNLSLFNNHSAEVKYVRINGIEVPFSLRANNNIPNALIIGNYSDIKNSGDINKTDITVSVSIKGIDKLMFQQISKNTNITLKSNWTDPSFTGSILPSKRTIEPEGFQAKWELSSLLNASGKSPRILSEEDSFGFSLFMPVNVYSLTDRSIKYAVLFIGFTFLAFFLFEIFGQLKIHPFQYILVGFALTIFYLLLLSLSEFINFALSYSAASAATIGLITLYSGKILLARKRTFIMGGMLTMLYSFLYILLQLDQYSLILGSVALFIVLASIMYLTRDVNWYELQER